MYVTLLLINYVSFVQKIYTKNTRKITRHAGKKCKFMQSTCNAESLDV